jgi:hypothetical protein
MYGERELVAHLSGGDGLDLSKEYRVNLLLIKFFNTFNPSFRPPITLLAGFIFNLKGIF